MESIKQRKIDKKLGCSDIAYTGSFSNSSESCLGMKGKNWKKIGDSSAENCGCESGWGRFRFHNFIKNINKKKKDAVGERKMQVIGKAKILRDGGVELSSEAKEKVKDLVGKIVKIVIEEEKEVANPLLDLCGRADIEIKDASINHDKYIYGRK